MAISRFKEIIDNKGYKITLADRTIFERSVTKSPFGLDSTLPNQHNNTDVIEFMLFDSNNNQLPQGDSGKLVRYVYLDDANINEYITISTVDDNRHIDSNQYVINAEKLIKDAGYSNGIFNVQITLLNRRIGTDITIEDKLWIHDISPSRTEIRVIPVKGNTDDTVIADLQERYNLFLKDGQFRDDTMHFVHEFIEQINLHKVLSNMLTSRGDTISSKSYIDIIKDEFKIYDFDKFLNDVRSTYIEAMIYFVSNCDYNPLSLNYGKPLPDDVSVALSVIEIYDTAVDIIASVVDSVLPYREIIKDSVFVEETNVNIDELKEVIKSDKIIEPREIKEIIHKRPPREDELIPDTLVTKTFYMWSDRGYIEYVNEHKKPTVIKGVEYDELNISYIGKPKFTGDIREIQKMKISNKICNDPRASNYGEVGVCEYKQIDMITHKLPEDKNITVYKKTKKNKKLTIDGKVGLRVE